MLLVKTYVAPSKIHGLGLFAAEKIKEGQKIWEFVPGLDTKISQSAYEKLPTLFQEHVYNYCYINRFTKEFVCPADNDRFTNHSDNPNTKCLNFGETEGTTFALRDIQKDEEITSNYNEFEDVDWPSVIRA